MWEGCQVLWNKKLLTPLEQDLGYLLRYTVVLTERIVVYRKNGQKFTWGETRVQLLPIHTYHIVHGCERECPFSIRGVSYIDFTLGFTQSTCWQVQWGSRYARNYNPINFHTYMQSLTPLSPLISPHTLYLNSSQEGVKAAPTTVEQAHGGFDGLCPYHRCSHQRITYFLSSVQEDRLNKSRHHTN